MIRKPLVPIVVVFLAFAMLTGCPANPKPVTLPPGALNTFDAQTFTSLMGAQAVLNSVKADYAAGKLPNLPKPALNSAIQSYNTAENAWKVYHAAGGGDTTALTQAVTAATASAVALVTQATGGH